MTHAIDILLRPLVRWYFQSWFWKYLPKKEKILWFFCKPYFVVGNDELRQKLIDFIHHRYNILLNFCGDDATSDKEIIATKNVYLEFIALVKEIGITERVILSLKNSRFGCFHRTLKWHGKKAVEVVVQRAAEAGIQIVFDGERLCYAAWVLAFADKLNKKYSNVSVRMQAYNKNFKPLFKKKVERIPLAICKGAYAEAKRDICSPEETKENILWAVRFALAKNIRIEVDTHDSGIISECLDELEYHFIHYGFLLNVKAWLAWTLMRESETVLLYLVFVKDTADESWIGYSIRRLVEKPTYFFLPIKLMWHRLVGAHDYW